ncbi:MAG: hypothetical protein MNPFHGCM_01643 [Gemmatimonadaceae bacterium]|nr:hypothetical protein [Gemmatimonadaceae bacterium]
MPDARMLTPDLSYQLHRTADIEAHRRRGALWEARRLAEAALRDDPDIAELYDAYARVLADANELRLAGDAWEKALAIEPGRIGALKGLGFLAFRDGNLRGAERRLAAAAATARDDPGILAALARVRRAISDESLTHAYAQPRDQDAIVQFASALEVPADRVVQRHPDSPARVVAALEDGDTELGADGAEATLVCDCEGLLLAGRLGGADDGDAQTKTACEVGALATSIARASQHLSLGEWQLCLLDGEDSACAIGRIGPSMLVLTEVRGEAAAGRVLAKLPSAVGRATNHLRVGP